MSAELRLLATSEAVPEVRRQLRHHGFDVGLCVSELLTNVIDHVGEGTPVTVRVLGTPYGSTRVEVTDPDPRALPVLLRASPADESGRGLALLDALALRWGVEQGAGHKTVWCEVEGEAAEAAGHGGSAVPGPSAVAKPSRSPSACSPSP
ncbi:anti-sigma regulatory factor (Ser/Thr protein kinase) [Streptomyces sp. B3I7]|uniref:ATP-binding protein n=1 Tax=Streptomyces sp. B3I7 TaxID=3042269 RepID=UPI00278491DF|nr:ATP-binding protein [Streptomyces sp. B3I7]MDQ0811557.1 anti-sigma regulatory factor (Ser/Thr protein kinase) [Streptomyces sp. B3I7]